MIVYRLTQYTARLLARTLLRPLQVEGLEHVPRSGPFLLVANHESVLDPVLIQAVCPAVVHTMTRSAQFTAPGMGWYMPRLAAFPVRRYQVDPQAVRIALRRLAAGRPVGVYLEGERSWDGRLQPPRLGTLRLILRAGVPVVPVGVHGSYEVWPRWAGRPERGPVRIRFGAPIQFPGPIRNRAERERHVPDVAARMSAELLRLSDGEPGERLQGAVEKDL
ncbi:MAG: lysophospholipid acyltransferase family protein [Gemmatimonadota bacterium]